jgi:hypothetical protein
MNTMTEFLTPVFIMGIIFGSIIAIVYLSIRKKERMALIEKGMDARIFETRRTPMSLKWGILLIGIGVGILLGRLFTAFSCLGEEVSYFSMITLCGGISLLIYHIIAWRMEKTEPSRE